MRNTALLSTPEFINCMRIYDIVRNEQNKHETMALYSHSRKWSILSVRIRKKVMLYQGRSRSLVLPECTGVCKAKNWHQRILGRRDQAVEGWEQGAGDLGRVRKTRNEGRESWDLTRGMFLRWNLCNNLVTVTEVWSMPTPPAQSREPPTRHPGNSHLPSQLSHPHGIVTAF